MEDQEFLTGEEAVRRLNMTPQQLNALVSEGELRMYRHGGETMFRAEDIENLRKKSETDATIVLPSASAAGDTDEESSEVEIESVDSELDDSDQTSVLPLDLPEADPLLSLDEDSEAPTVLEEGKGRGETEVMNGLEAIDLDEVQEPARPDADIDLSSGLLEVVEDDESAALDQMVSSAESDAVTTAETSGLEPSTAEETMGLEPAEATDIGTVPMDVVDAEDSATVALEAVEDDISTAESAFAPGGGIAPGMAGAMAFEDVEPEGVATLIGLVLTTVAMAFGAVLWGGYWLMTSQNPLIDQFVGLFK
ncbi:MAG: helix-turn-helix domain-containing protein [Planctomycetes bacterium]|nr:helix-turn-helix domain-containing protein [Planctomycetota bacterium]